jgi:hypothetical protein
MAATIGLVGWVNCVWMLDLSAKSPQTDFRNPPRSHSQLVRCDNIGGIVSLALRNCDYAKQKRLDAVRHCAGCGSRLSSNVWMRLSDFR